MKHVKETVTKQTKQIVLETSLEIISLLRILSVSAVYTDSLSINYD